MFCILTGEVPLNYFGQDDLAKIDRRTMAAFRRFDILERYLKRESWWEENM
ncbi:MAG: hypothetical protein HFH85_02760 [Lachnospiraceae bacterium]|nr:hypothetical protein [Lachnospiraceae bacterium]